MRKLSLLVCSLLLLSLAACGGGSSNGLPDLPAGPNTGGGGGDAAPATTASVMGKISFEGEVPKPVKLQTTADPACKKELFTEDTKVKDGGLENVIIYVSGGDAVAGKSFAPPSTPVEINQIDCHYIPHALVLQVGQKLSIKNSDMTLHNIHAFAEVNAPFNTGQAVQGLVTEHVFDKKEILLPVKCDVHKWMGAFIAVVDNPFATVSTEGGKYELKLPAGKFEITAIHEKYGKQTAMVEVKDGDHTMTDFKFKASDAKSGN
jgi:plastocyanin